MSLQPLKDKAKTIIRLLQAPLTFLGFYTAAYLSTTGIDIFLVTIIVYLGFLVGYIILSVLVGVLVVFLDELKN